MNYYQNRNFKEYDFIKLFLNTLNKNDIKSINPSEMENIILNLYHNSEYKLLFEQFITDEDKKFKIGKMIEYAVISGLISLPEKNNLCRTIRINDEEIASSYNEEIVSSMELLVSNIKNNYLENNDYNKVLKK